MELGWEIYLLLWGAGLLGGFVDSIAGGGGIITVPILLAVGMPPHMALGTNKLQASFGSVTASVHYSRSELVDIRKVKSGIAFTAIGALIGTLAIQMISPEFLNRVLPILLTGIFIYVLFSPERGKHDTHPAANPLLFYLAAGLGIGFYDGFFGPGTGNFWTICFILFLGHNMKKATAHTKIMNATSNLISLAAFAIGGNILIVPGIIMGSAQLLGASLGAHMVLKKGTGFVRIFFLCVVAVTIGKVVYSSYFGG